MMFIHLPEYDFIEAEVKEDDVHGRRYVTPEGKSYPSITTVLGRQPSPELDLWRARVGEEEARKVSNKATRRGNKLHEMAEFYLKNQPLPKADMFAMSDFNRFKPVLDNINNIHLIERALYSDFLKIAGRVDCIGEYDGVLSVIDFKTSNQLKQKSWISDYFKQATAYSVMFEERTGVKAKQLVILIAVDEDKPQVFIEQRKDWIVPLGKLVTQYGG